MPLNDMQIRRAKPEDKPYTLGDGQGLSLLIEPNGSKSWRFRYRYAGKPKMISLGCTQRSPLPMLVPVVMKRENLWPKERTLVRFEKSKSWLCKQSQRTRSKR
jgi:hypothetical protein